MIINNIKLLNFRNHDWLEINNPASLVIIIGDNAAGKTNIIEGLQLLCMQESFRNPITQELIKNNKDEAKITISFSNNDRQLSVSLQIANNHKSYNLNDKYKKPIELSGLLPAVLFTPDDLYLAKGPAGARRDFLDSLGGRLSKTFSSIKKDYTRVIKQKNLLLKAENVEAAVLDSWNQNLAKLGASLYVHRVGLYNKLLAASNSIYQQISGGEELSSSYIASFLNNKKQGDNSTVLAGVQESVEHKNGYSNLPPAEAGVGATEELSQEEVEQQLLVALQAGKAEELAAKRSLVGPHRDDINFYINGQDVRRFGSQGQQRSVALALKIAEIEILRQVIGSEPLLLLDDVMSELDEQRRGQLLRIIENSTQTFITTTNLGYFDQPTIERAQLLQLNRQSENQFFSAKKAGGHDD